MSNKSFALGFDFYNSELNKFHFTVIDMDLMKNGLFDYIADILKKDYGLTRQDVTIKVHILNNIEM